MSQPEWARRRTLEPNPYTAWHRHVGNANSVVSKASNVERMFPYYHDVQQRSKGPARPASADLGESRNGSSRRPVSPGWDIPLRWEQSKGMALWGNVHQPASSPLSHTTGGGRRRRSASPVGRGRAMSPVSGQVSTSSVGGKEGAWECREGEDAAKSFTRFDDENLSGSMKRSLGLLNMLPYRGPFGRSGAANGDVSGAADATPPRPMSSSRLTTPSKGSPQNHEQEALTQSLVRSLMGVDEDKAPSGKHKGARRPSTASGTAGKGKAKPAKPQDLYGEFVRMRDALDAANGVGGIKVGFGGLRLLSEHVEKGLVTSETPLVIEVEFCTHGYDCVSRGDQTTSKYYTHYIKVCDVLEKHLFPAWNVCFVIKRGRPRQGSFEVELLWVVGSLEYSVTLASKVCNAKFPNAENIAKRLHAALHPDS